MRRIPFISLNVTGILAFALPFLVALSPADSAAGARGSDAPWILALLIPLIVGVTLAEATGGRLDAKTLALLGSLAGCAALMRLPISFAGANLIFFLPMICGAVFGASFGFVVGSLAIAVSAVLTGGVGPRLPFQMLATGWIAMGAALLGGFLRSPQRSRNHKAVALATYGAVAAFIFGALMDLYFWPVVSAGDTTLSWRPGLGLRDSIQHFGSFYLITSLAWDLIGAVANVLVMLALGPSVFDLLQRYRTRFSFMVEVRDYPARGTVDQSKVILLQSK